ncbi:unnamed protein product [Porites evermanni]|uniref:ubiquitinyl hydrolase 1 n=1 Tax=Porites evermanni TaxID=104178 RepID=A0ABN8LLI3_9CNID|nr:unnamed protein product [Porites evermanni]
MNTSKGNILHGGVMDSSNSNFRMSQKLPTFEAHQEQDKSKAELGLTEEQVETLKQVSSLVGMFQQEALNEKQTRLLAQLKALEKTQVERLKAQNSKLNTESFLSRRHSSRLSGNTREVLIESNNRFKDELSKLFCKISTVRTTQGHLGDKEMKEQQRELKDVVDTVPLSTSSNKETSKTVDTRNQDVIHQENDSAQDSPVTPPREFRDPVAGVCGLENLGNTCFVNAGLQCLFSVAPFCRFFLGGGHNTVTHKSPKENQVSLSKHLADLVKKVWSGCYLQCDPSELYKAITAHFPTQLNRQRQHDCHEFLALFLDGLHRELNCSTLPSLFPDQSDNNVSAEEKWRQYTMSNESLIVDTFQGQLQSKVTCSNCNHESVKYQPFTFLSVPILSESYHTFVVTWVYSYTPNTSHGNTLSAVRYKVQVTKPSTVLKLKSNFLSLLTAEKETPQLKDIVVCVVRNSQIISIMEDGQQLTPFTDRRSKLYIVKPCQVPESPYVQEDEKSTSFSCLAGRDSTVFYSPDVANTTEFMSALDELQSVSSPVSKNHLTRLVNPDTSTPKTPRQRTRASISTVYHLSGTCCICLEEKLSDKELISHDKCGSLFCRQCLQDAVGGAVENHLCCPVSAVQILQCTTYDSSAMILVPVVLRRFEEDSKTKRLFGHPNLIIVSKNFRGKDLYAFVEKMLPEPIRQEQDSASLPAFTLHLVEQQGRHCSRCTRITGCGGCQVNKEAILNLQTCDNLAVQLKTIGRWEAERMSRCTEHESIWKPRKREDPLKLEHCLKRFVESEKLPDSWFCQKCHEERNAFKALSICRLPDTLIIHLKRYTQNGVKITTPVEFPLEGLDVCEYTQLEDCPPEQFLYDLIGCVCHQGSYSSGHYTSYTNTNKVWYRYDDCHVTKVTEGNENSLYSFCVHLKLSLSCLSLAKNWYYPQGSRHSYAPINVIKSRLSLIVRVNVVLNRTVFTLTLVVLNPKYFSSDEKTTTTTKTKKSLYKEQRFAPRVFHSVSVRTLTERDKQTQGALSFLDRQLWRKLKKNQRKSSPMFNPQTNKVKVSKCYCKQCEYLTILEKQIKKAKLCTSEVTPLETAEKGNIDSRKSSLTSVSHSVSSSLSPSAANSCSNTSSSEEATQVNKKKRDDGQQNSVLTSRTSRQLLQKKSPKKLEAEKLSERLQCAVENENIRRAVMLLRRGADPNILVNGLSALHVAVGLESPLNIHFTRLLLDYGGNPDIASAEGLTPIHVATMWNRVNCLKLLIDRGGNPYVFLFLPNLRNCDRSLKLVLCSRLCSLKDHFELLA